VPSAPAPIGVAAASPEASVYAPLDTNPYLPFFHVWKPVSSWSKVKWDRGSSEGIAQQKPDYILAVVEYVFNHVFLIVARIVLTSYRSRDTPMPTLAQLDGIFRMLPDEPKGPVRRVGPQYDRKRPNNRPVEAVEQPSWWRKLLKKVFPQPQPSGNHNAVNALRNGDRAFIVAVNDSGNTGWVRFGRTGFESVPMA
jgi:tRNA-splicing endonuclease subunit Sen54